MPPQSLAYNTITQSVCQVCGADKFVSAIKFSRGQRRSAMSLRGMTARGLHLRARRHCTAGVCGSCGCYGKRANGARRAGGSSRKMILRAHTAFKRLTNGNISAIISRHLSEAHCARDIRGYGSVGRAMRSQRIGQGFESPYLHQ